MGTIPICRSSALNPLYEQLPVLIVRDWTGVTPTLRPPCMQVLTTAPAPLSPQVRDWTDVTPRLLRNFLVNYTIRKPFYRYGPSSHADCPPHCMLMASLIAALCTGSRYEKLFADYWVGQVALPRARAPLIASDCL